MIFRSPYPDVTIPDMPLAPFVLRHAARLADKPALVDGVTGHVLTFGRLAEAVERTAAGLAARGFRKGDVLAISAPNCPEFGVAFYAALSLGGVVTPANPALTADELARQLNDAGATYLLTVPGCLGPAVAAVERSNVREIFVIGQAPGATSFADLHDSDALAAAIAIEPSHDVAVLPYSSGTTGLPKGVMLTHANLVANTVQVTAVEPLTEADILIGILPFFHVYGMTVLLNYALSVGATVVTLPRFELEQFLQTMQAYGVTYAYLAPPIVLALAKQPVVERYDLSRLKIITCGAAPLSSDIAAGCEDRLGCVVKQGYGLTEASPVTHMSPPESNRIKSASVGSLLPNTEGKIVDPATGVALGANQQGEIWIRGPQVMRGYFNQPQASAAMIDTEGWLRTGDIGYVDEDGFFYIVDRLKELIKVKGFQVAPAELEGVLLAHPAVADAAVIPYPDEEAGEIPKAFVVLRGAATPEDLIGFVAARVAPYKKVRLLEIVDHIPKSASGKILRRVLVERERIGQLVRG
ncbi:MAG: 4-coumarate--CoA ligase family protein [Chloroflexia bacterium]|nr:4-coumarate--CoA ligase family protein [Chloroflexia bacterium]